tara:strand:- start:25 stop:285 length:261 start_codon:yes stop_codon:yes gene_type:complete
MSQPFLVTERILPNLHWASGIRFERRASMRGVLSFVNLTYLVRCSFGIIVWSIRKKVAGLLLLETYRSGESGKEDPSNMIYIHALI